MIVKIDTRCGYAAILEIARGTGWRKRDGQGKLFIIFLINTCVHTYREFIYIYVYIYIYIYCYNLFTINNIRSDDDICWLKTFDNEFQVNFSFLLSFSLSFSFLIRSFDRSYYVFLFFLYIYIYIYFFFMSWKSSLWRSTHWSVLKLCTNIILSENVLYPR